MFLILFLRDRWSFSLSRNDDIFGWSQIYRIEQQDIAHELHDVFVCACFSCLFTSPVTVRTTRYLSLCDDVEGAALLSLPDDVLSFVIVFLVGKGEREGEDNSQSWGITLI